MEISNEILETLGNTRGNRINEKNGVETTMEEEVETSMEGGMETFKTETLIELIV